MDLRGKYVLVTGGSTGLGEQICLEAAKKGAILIICARNVQQIEAVKEKCMLLSNEKAYAYPLDISDPDQIEDVVAKIELEVGAIDILVNNAGFGIFEEFLSFDFEEIRSMFEVNVLGLMLLTQKISARMVLKQQGHIINIASVAGKIATPQSTIYSATKFAVVGFSNALRLELKPYRVFVTTVNPGPIHTNFFNQADPSGEYLEKIGKIVLDPQKLAAEIVRNMERPKREINRPRFFNYANQCYQLFPKIGDFLAGGIFNKK